MSDAPPAAGTPAASAAPDAGPAAGDPASVAPPAGGAGRAPGKRAGRRVRGFRSRRRAVLYVLAGLVVAAGAGWALLGNQVFVVRSVTVTGTHLVTPARVIAAADVPVGTPLLRVDPGSVTRRVESIPQVASATVTEDWPDHLTIAVTERVPVMAVRMAGGGYDLVDPAGVIVRQSQARPAALPLLVTSLRGSALRGATAVTTAADVLAELQPWLARQVTEVSAAPVAAGTVQVTLDMKDGQTVEWGSPGDAAQKNRELAILLPGGAHDIDVSTPGTVVTR